MIAQLRALRRERAADAEQEVDVEAALVRLVDDQRVIATAAGDRPPARAAARRRSRA